MPHSGASTSRPQGLPPIVRAAGGKRSRGSASSATLTALDSFRSLVAPSPTAALFPPIAGSSGVHRTTGLIQSRAAVFGGLHIARRPAPESGVGAYLGAGPTALDYSARSRPAWATGHIHQLDQIRLDLRRSSRALSTRQLYWCWWLTWVAFCTVHNFVPFPAESLACERYVAFLLSGYTVGTIEIALAAIAAVHADASVSSPTRSHGVRQCIEGARRFLVVRPTESKLALTVETLVDLCTLTGNGRWTALRLLRAKCMMALGFLAYLRRREIVELDVCDIDVAADGVAFDITVRQSKNDQYAEGRVTHVGRHGLPDCIASAIEGWLQVVGGRRDRVRCTKRLRPWERCLACGPLFMRLGGVHGAGGVRPAASCQPCAKGSVSDELRSLLKAVPSFTGDLSRYSAISLRKGGSSAAAAVGVAEHIRQCVGRWRGPAAMRRSYTLVTRLELAGATSALFARM